MSQSDVIRFAFELGNLRYEGLVSCGDVLLPADVFVSRVVQPMVVAALERRCQDSRGQADD